MKKTAIILATAAVFDLGVMVISVQAQEVFRPVTGDTFAGRETTPNRDHIDQDAQRTACANGKHIPDARLSACRDPAPFDPSASSGPAGQARAADMFLKIDRVNTVQACTARQGTVVRREGVQQCRLPADVNRPPAGPTGGRAGGISGIAVQDPTGPGGNGGCIPGPPGTGGSTGPCTGEPAAIGNPTRNLPGGIPPRN